jgi:hypothetical protein
MKYICDSKHKCLAMFCERKTPHSGKRSGCKASLGIPGACDIPATTRKKTWYSAESSGKHLRKPRSMRGTERP